MTAVRYLVVIFLVMMACACSDAGQGQSAKSLPDTPENRTTLAKQYLEAMPTKIMLRGIATREVHRFPEKDQKPFMEIMASPEMEKEANRLMIDGLVKNFTVGELKAMVTFYSSPEGQSALKKFGPFIAEIMPQLQEKVKKGLAETQKPTVTMEPLKPPAPPGLPGKKAPKASPGKQ
jgi:hypothetical protein